MRISGLLSELSQITEASAALDANTAEAQGKLPLDRITGRAQDTRPLDSEHVLALAFSIAMDGLINPICVDAKGVLIAGGHRHAAIQLLSDPESIEVPELQEIAADAWERFFPGGLVPVRVLDFSVAEDPERALRLEIIENEKRRDYTPDEVRQLAANLISTGRYSDGRPGRPAPGKVSLNATLQTIIGKSERTVRNYLAGSTQAQRNAAVSAETLVGRAGRLVQQLQLHDDVPTSEDATLEQIQRLLKRVAGAIALPQENKSSGGKKKTKSTSRKKGESRSILGPEGP
jgi:ParB family transcriptional regulator, chromosome partitioning protein